MPHAIDAIINPATLLTLQQALATAHFADGRATAGGAAASVKDNEQAAGTHRDAHLARLVEQALLEHWLFKAAAQPKAISRILFSRYRADMAYGLHVDEALIGGARSDLSFTLFLSEPDSYDGGALVIDGGDGESAVKLPAGALYLYPSTSLHHVEPVTGGERLAAVGWVRSLIRRDDARSILFDLDLASRELYQREGKTPLFDRLTRAKTNLKRYWLED